MITVHIYFCHTEKQAEKTIEKIKRCDQSDRFMIFHTLRYDVLGNNDCKTPCKIDVSGINNLSVTRINCDNDLIKYYFYEELTNNRNIIEGTIIEVDLTYAHINETFSVCWASAAIELNAYIERSENGKIIKEYLCSVPPFVPMNNNEVKIIDSFGSKRIEFTNNDANVAIDGDANLNAAKRATTSLLENGFISKTNKKKNRRVGRNSDLFTVNGIGEYMAGMNRRSKNNEK